MSKPTRRNVIPNLPTNIDPSMRQFLEAVRETMQVTAGQRGNKLDSAVTFRDLDGRFGAAMAAINNIRDEIVRPEPSDPLGPPTGLGIAYAFDTSMVFWDYPYMKGYAYSEVFRIGQPVLEGVTPVAPVFTTDSLLATVNGSRLTDTIAPDHIYYYWVRHVGQDGTNSAIAGPVTAIGSDLPSTIIDQVYNDILTDEFILELQNRLEVVDLTPLYNADATLNDLLNTIDARLTAADNRLTAADAALSASIASANQALANADNRLTQADATLSQAIADTNAILSAADTRLTNADAALSTSLAQAIATFDEALGDQTSAIITLENVTADQASQLAGLTTRVGGAESTILTLNTTTAGHASRLESIETVNATQGTSIVSLNTTTATHATAITRLGAYDTTAGKYTFIKTLEEVDADQANQITSLSSRTSAAESSITTLNNTTATQATSLTNLTSRVGTAESSITTLSTTTAGHASRLESIETVNTTQGTSIASLNTTTATHATAITRLGAYDTTAGKYSFIKTLEDVGAGQASQIASLTTRTTAAENSITSLNSTTDSQATSLTNLTSRVGTAESSITTLNTTTAGHASRLESIETVNTTQGASIASLNTTTATHATAITRLGAYDTAAGKYSFIKTLEEVDASQSIRMSAIETVNTTQGTSIAELNTTTATHATAITRLGAYDTAAGKYSFIKTLEEVDASQGVRISAIETVNTTQGTSIATLNTTTADHALAITRLGAYDHVAGKYSFIRTLELVDANQADLIQSLNTRTGTIETNVTTLGQTTTSQALRIDQVQLQLNPLPLSLTSEATWVVGTYGNQSGFSRNGENNRVVNGIGPYGTTAKIWHGIANGDNQADGGFEGSYLPIDNTLSHRFSIWIKAGVNNNAGSSYLGLYSTPAAVTHMYGTPEGNPYFYSGGIHLQHKGKWLLYVGVLHPVGYTGPMSSETGVYDPSTGQKVANGTDFIASAGTAQVLIRSYQYYSGHTTINTMDFAHPRIDVMNGSQPSLTELLTSALSTAVQNSMRAYVNEKTGELEAQQVLKVDANGVVASMGLRATSGGTSQIAFVASEMAFVNNRGDTPIPALAIRDGRLLFRQAIAEEILVEKLVMKTGIAADLAVLSSLQMPAGVIKADNLHPDLRSRLVMTDPDASATGGSATILRVVRCYSSPEGRGTGNFLSTSILGGGNNTEFNIKFSGEFFASGIAPGQPAPVRARPFIRFKLYRNGERVAIPSNIIANYNEHSNNQLFDMGWDGYKVEPFKMLTGEPIWGGGTQWEESVSFNFVLDLKVGRFNNEAVYSLEIVETSGEYLGLDVMATLDIFEPTGSTGGLVVQVAWDSIPGKPATATRWPTFDEVSGKPSVYGAALKVAADNIATYGSHGLQFAQFVGIGGGGTNGAQLANPDADWWHSIVLNHNNSAGYYTQIATCFHKDEIKFKRVVQGGHEAWRNLIHDGNIHAYSPSQAGFGAYGTWGINITGNAGSVSDGVYLSGTQTITGNKVFANAVYMSDIRGDSPVMFLTSGAAARNIHTGGVLTSFTYNDAGLVPTHGIYSRGGIRTDGLIRQGKFRTFTVTTDYPGSNFGNARCFVRICSNGSSCFMGGRIRISGGWSYSSAMGLLEREFSIYVPAGESTTAHCHSRISAMIGAAGDHLRISDVQVVDGWIGFYIWEHNSNSIDVRVDTYIQAGIEPESISTTAWVSDPLPAKEEVTFNGLNNVGTITSTNFVGNGSGLHSLNAATLNAAVNSVAAVPWTISQRDGENDLHARLFRSSYPDDGSAWGAIAFRGNTSDNYIRFTTNYASVRDLLSVPSSAGAGAHGSWNINAATASALQSSRLINRVAFNGSTNIEISEFFHSHRDFTLGTLVTTNIDYSQTSGRPWCLEITGNSYTSGESWDLKAHGYIWNDSLLNVGGHVNGMDIPGIVAMNISGWLCFWWPRHGYWQGFNVKVYEADSGLGQNKVTSVQDVSDPGGTKRVTISDKLRARPVPVSMLSQWGGANKVAQYADNGYLYAGNWIQSADGRGLFWPSGTHLHSVDNGHMRISGSLGHVRMDFVNSVGVRGYVNADGSGIGFLDHTGTWAIHTNGEATQINKYLRVNHNIQTSWINGYHDPAIGLKTRGTVDGYSPWISQRTPAGGWSMGTLNNSLYLNFATNSNIDSWTNSIHHAMRVDSDGSVFVSDRIFDMGGVKYMKWSDFSPTMGPPAGLENVITANWLSAGVVQANIIASGGINVVDGGNKVTIHPKSQTPIRFEKDGVETFSVSIDGTGYFKGKLADDTVEANAITDEARRAINPYYIGKGQAFSHPDTNVLMASGSSFVLGTFTNVVAGTKIPLNIRFSDADTWQASSGTPEPAWNSCEYLVSLERSINGGSFEQVSSQVGYRQLSVGVSYQSGTTDYDRNGNVIGVSGPSKQYSYVMNRSVIDVVASSASTVQYRVVVSLVSGSGILANGVKRRGFSGSIASFATNPINNGGVVKQWWDKETGYCTCSMSGFLDTVTTEVLYTFPTPFIEVWSCVIGESSNSGSNPQHKITYRDLTNNSVRIRISGTFVGANGFSITVHGKVAI